MVLETLNFRRKCNPVDRQMHATSHNLASKKRTWIPYIFIAAPALISVLLVIHYGVNVPYGDEWTIVDLNQTIQKNGLHFSSFFEQHNEHRIIFPRIVLLATAVMSKWNVVPQMLLTQLMLVIVAVCYCKYFISRNGRDSKILWATVPLMILLFSLDFKIFGIVASLSTVQVGLRDSLEGFVCFH